MFQIQINNWNNLFLLYKLFRLKALIFCYLPLTPWATSSKSNRTNSSAHGKATKSSERRVRFSAFYHHRYRRTRTQQEATEENIVKFTLLDFLTHSSNIIANSESTTDSTHEKSTHEATMCLPQTDDDVRNAARTLLLVMSHSGSGSSAWRRWAVATFPCEEYDGVYFFLKCTDDCGLPGRASSCKEDGRVN